MTIKKSEERCIPVRNFEKTMAKMNKTGVNSCIRYMEEIYSGGGYTNLEEDKENLRLTFM